MRLPIALVLAASAALVGSPGVITAHPGPAAFVRSVDNPWFPLVPGTTFVYRGVKDGEPTRDVVHVTSRVRVVDGVRCIAVTDRLYASGRLAERTTDWYAQDRRGNVWYFGENTKTLRNGTVTSTKGSWAAGRNGASAGIVMEAHPRVGDTYSQEDAPGVGEDRAKVLSLDAAATVPYGTFTGLLKTKDFSPLEPAVVEHKFFLRGVGSILEKEVRGGNERLALVKVVRP